MINILFLEKCIITRSSMIPYIVNAQKRIHQHQNSIASDGFNGIPFALNRVFQVEEALPCTYHDTCQNWRCPSQSSLLTNVLANKPWGAAKHKQTSMLRRPSNRVTVKRECHAHYGTLFRIAVPPRYIYIYIPS